MAAAAAAEDIVYLVNGDRLTGAITGRDSDSVTLKTEYVDALAIPRSAIREVVRTGQAPSGEPVMGRVDLASGQDTPDALPLKEVIAVEETDPARVEALRRALIEGRLTFAEDGAARITDGPGQGASVPAAARRMPAEAAPTPEPAPESAEADKWAGSVSASLLLRRGESDSVDAMTDIEVRRKWPRDVLTGSLSAAYGELESEGTTQKASGQLKLQHYVRERLYLYGLGGADHDAVRKLDVRLRAAAGVGYDFIKTDSRSLSADVGVAYAREYWRQYGLLDEDEARENAEQAVDDAVEAFLLGVVEDPFSLRFVRVLELIGEADGLRFRNETTTEDSVSLRGVVHFKQALFTKSKFAADFTYEPDLDDVGTYRLLSELTFTTPLSNRLDLRIGLNSEYDSDPGSGDVDDWDHILSTGLKYRF
ncbi:MAG: DUF481 domain-containing protein [Candidatus Hydrogenedentes bacterium]|nr:DUF481 domain-containing protein [Candidatus Hydrogenedentota bacterium]